jgi:ATP-dependent Clp protease, protease subunit
VTPQLSPGAKHQGVMFVGFNAAIDRKASGQLAMVCGSAVQNEFQEIHLLLTTTGGISDQAYYAVTILQSLPLKLVTYNVGNVLSAGTLLYLTGKERYATKESPFYFHETDYDPSAGRISEVYLMDRLRSLRAEDRRSVQFVSERTGQPEAIVKRLRRTQRTVTASEAIDLGIVHSIRVPNMPKSAFFHQVIV